MGDRMTGKIAKRMAGGYYLWQADAYGSRYLDRDAPAEIYRSRPMPSTPQGDHVATAATALIGDSWLDRLAGLSAERAREILRDEPGVEVND